MMNPEPRVMKKLLLVLLLWAPLPAFAGDLPDSHLTPGAANPAVNQGDIGSTICMRGYTKTIRPPAYYTNRLKRLQIREYGYADRNPRDYEEDHLIPLEVGGNPTSPRNLWPEPRRSEYSAKKKDELENRLHRMVCDGEMPLKEAQKDFTANWIAAYKQYVHARW